MGWEGFLSDRYGERVRIRVRIILLKLSVLALKKTFTNMPGIDREQALEGELRIFFLNVIFKCLFYT